MLRPLHCHHCRQRCRWRLSTAHPMPSLLRSAPGLGRPRCRLPGRAPHRRSPRERPRLQRRGCVRRCCAADRKPALQSARHACMGCVGGREQTAGVGAVQREGLRCSVSHLAIQQQASSSASAAVTPPPHQSRQPCSPVGLIAGIMAPQKNKQSYEADRLLLTSRGRQLGLGRPGTAAPRSQLAGPPPTADLLCPGDPVPAPCEGIKEARGSRG